MSETQSCTTPAATPDDLDHAIDSIILDTAATEAAGALLVAHAYVMRLGPANAAAALEDGQGAVFYAITEAIQLQTLVAAIERDYPSEDGWKAAQHAIANAFGAEWARETLGWTLQVASVKTSEEAEPGADSLVRWALALPVMGGLLPALDALLALGPVDGQGEAARSAIEVIGENILAAIERGVKADWLQRSLDVWTGTTGGLVITFTRQPT